MNSGNLKEVSGFVIEIFRAGELSFSNNEYGDFCMVRLLRMHYCRLSIEPIPCSNEQTEGRSVSVEKRQLVS